MGCDLPERAAPGRGGCVRVRSDAGRIAVRPAVVGARNGHFSSEGGARRSLRGLIALVTGMTAMLALGGCEAGLDLSGVRQEEKQVLRRYDELEAAVRRRHTARTGEEDARQAAIVIVGRGGLVVLADEHGVPRRRIVLPRSGDHRIASLIDIAECPDGRLAALDFYRAVWTSREPGGAWTRHPLPVDEDPAAITCDPDGRLWVTASFTTILRSDDGGRSWHARSLDEDAVLTHIRFFDARRAVTVGEFGLVFRSEDGGETWEPAPPIPDEFYPAAALFADPDRGWVGGLDGVIYATRDGGRNWRRQDTEGRMPIFRFLAADDDGRRIFAVGDNGTVLRLTDEGRWVRSAATVSHDYLRVAVALDADELLVGGGRGVLRRLRTDPRPAAEKAAAASPTAPSRATETDMASGGRQ